MQNSLAKKVFKDSVVENVGETISLDVASCSNKIIDIVETAAVSTTTQRPNKSVYDKGEHDEEELEDADKNPTTFTLLIKAKSSKNTPKKPVVNRRTCHLAVEEKEDFEESVTETPQPESKEVSKSAKSTPKKSNKISDKKSPSKVASKISEAKMEVPEELPILIRKSSRKKN